ncbi:uncharacterized protein MKZ38_005066 [Zalerion maritima]|uniref:Kinesin motor domain-containing protein n=1 Tax=Zalerion maritima TaxID=339359 RepID=A0AAD5RL42_9PEZI|nr:uncharacterized protein MKZ38_005066 [Zalerion maritima]
MSVRVVARIRPLLEKEQAKDVIVTTSQTEDGKPVVKIPSPRNESEEFSFGFNSVYGSATTQEQLFSAEVSPHTKALFQGIDVTFFAYGVTGTGKTHTMRGGLKLADRGVIPRLLSNVFRRAKKIGKDTTGNTSVDVHLSYYEIYNDKVFDLLEPIEKRTVAGLPLREKDGKTIVVGLSERLCQDLKDFEKLYIEANNNRVTASTKLNAHSSRSHAILRVKLTQTTGDMVKESVASAIDLAGSEDNRRTDNGKERLVESAAINKSLFVLSQCIDAISRGDKRIPYRESKMTRILSLGQNNGITVMVLNLAPLRSYHLDTLSSLNVSSRAKRIEVREIENEVVFKTQPPRAATSTAPGISRQPLRPIASTHNALAGAIAKEKEKPERPAKAFHVYSDKPQKPVTRSVPTANTTVRRTALKRSSEPDHTVSGPKTTRPALGPKPKAEITAADIEAMVEKKVAEILASRATEQVQRQPSPSLETEAAQQQPVHLSDEVQKRLEALEKKVDASARTGDERSPGLRFLMHARSAKENGDDEAALAHYEAALPFFPGQSRLISKIDKLKAKLAAKQAALNVDSGFDTGEGVDAGDELDVQKLERLSPAKLKPRSPRKERKRKAFVVREDGESESDAGDADHEAEEDSVIRKRKGKTNKHKRSKSVPEEEEGVSSSSNATPAAAASGPAEPASADPRVGKLLYVVNSRDETRMRELHGLGAKKVKDILDYLTVLGEGRSLQTLAQLRMVPGMGGKTIERALDSIGAC